MSSSTLNPADIEVLTGIIGEGNIRRLLDCQEVTVTFGADSKLATITGNVVGFKIWHIITLDGLPNSTGSNGLCGGVEGSVANPGQEVYLVVMSVRDLGFQGKAYYREICLRAKALGLGLCPAWVGQQLLVQYPCPDHHRQLIMAMEAILDSHQNLILFTIGHDSGRYCLGVTHGSPNLLWALDDKFLFVYER